MEKQAQEIFNHLITLEPKEQANHIFEIAQDSPALAKLVKQLIETHHQLATYDADKVESDLLQALAEQTEQTHSSPNKSGKTTFQPTFKNYAITEKLGSGGMGDVYLCQPLDKNLKNQVAIKLLNSHSSNMETQQRFIHEQRFLSQLKHPNISHFIDVGYTEDQLPYVVMEHCSGLPVTEFCNKKQLKPQQRIEIFLQLCDAVQYAHNNLIIHRDIKPNNVLVTDDGLKLLDFGIAKALDAQDQLTQTGIYAMTPAYASPEQIMAQPVSVASDIYSLGVVLYELLTGTRPHEFNNTTPAQYEKNLKDSIPQAPSQRVLNGGHEISQKELFQTSLSKEKLGKILQGDLDLIIGKTIRSEPNQRFNNVAELSDELHRYLDNQPILTRPASLAYYSKKFIQRNRTMVSLTAISVFFILTLLLSTLYQNRKIRSQSEELVIQRNQAIEEQKRAEFISNAFIQSFKNADPTQTEGLTITAHDILEETVNNIQSNENNEPSLTNKLVATIASVYTNLGEYQQTLDVLQLVAGNPKESSLPIQSELLVNEAEAINALGDSERAIEIIDAAQPELASRHELIRIKAMALSNLGNHADALALIQPIYQVTAPDDRSYLSICYEFGTYMMNQGQYNPTIELLKKCLSDVRTISNKDQLWQKSQIYLKISQAHWGLKNAEMSSENLLLAINMRERIFAKDHYFVTSLYGQLGSIHKILGNYDQAIEFHQIDLDGNIAKFGPNHLNSLNVQYNIGNIHFLKKDFSKAEQIYQQVISLVDESNANHKIKLAFYYLALGSARIEAKKLEAAESPLNQAIRIFNEVGNSYIYRAAEAQVLLADAYLQQKKYGDARTQINLALPNMYTMHQAGDEMQVFAEKIDLSLENLGY